MDSIRANVNEHTCAVMMELIQGEGGVMPLDQSFVQEVAAFCKERDLLLLVDEVQTGHRPYRLAVLLPAVRHQAGCCLDGKGTRRRCADWRCHGKHHL